MPTTLVIGAGPGLGLAIARRFGREGHKIGLVARDPARLARGLGELTAAGIDAAAFTADVLDPEQLDAALEEATMRLGAIDVVYYGPSPHGMADGQKPIQEISGADVADAMALVYPAADVVAKVLPSMLERRSGAFLLAGAVSAVVPLPELGALTFPAAAARSYAVTLHAALAPHGLYAGALLIGVLIDGSDLGAALSPEPAGRASKAYLLDPDRIADTAWELVTRRRSPEALVTAGPRGIGITMLLVTRLLRVLRRSARVRSERVRSAR